VSGGPGHHLVMSGISLEVKYVSAGVLCAEAITVAVIITARIIIFFILLKIWNSFLSFWDSMLQKYIINSDIPNISVKM
jgi:hypothetical protein